jgi:hypothetical protein
MSAEDILNEYHLQTGFFDGEKTREKNLQFDDEIERSIYEFLTTGEYDASAISLTLDIDASTVLYKCSVLEVK